MNFFFWLNFYILMYSAIYPSITFLSINKIENTTIIYALNLVAKVIIDIILETIVKEESDISKYSYGFLKHLNK